jgi:hypothetical protein
MKKSILTLLTVLMIVPVSIHADVVFPGGAGITIVTNTDLESNDMSFIGTSIAGSAQQTDYSDIKAGIVGNPGALGGVTAATSLAVNGVSDLGDGGTTNYTEVGATGDMTFVGSSGLNFAQIYEEDGSSTLVLAAQDTFYQIISFSANGESNIMVPDHTNDHITVTNTGKYLATIDISFSQTTVASIEYDFHIQKNNGATDFPQISAHRDTSGSSVIGNCGSTGIISLTAGDTVELWVERLTGGATSRTITLPQVSMNLIQIGG